MSVFRDLKWIGAFAFAVLLAIIISFSAPRHPPVDSIKTVQTPAISSRPNPPSVDFAGSAACTECHEEIAKRYQTHPMAQSMHQLDRPGFEESSEDVSFSAGMGLEYRIERKADRVWHHEIRRDANGDVIYDQAVEVHYSMGSGARGKGYLIERGDLLFMSPISWYAGKNVWDLSPGFVAGNHPRFERRVTDGCLMCHTGQVSFLREEPDRYPEPKFRELSIGCERCHGSGKQHIAYHRAQDGSLAHAKSDDATADSANESARSLHGDITKDSIVNPAKLEPRMREAVCNQCHLVVEQRLLRYGRSYFDFRPGMELDEIMTAFVSEDRTPIARGSSRAVGHVTQMRESQCYSKSNGRFGCISCHDSHFVPAESEKPEYYRLRCLKCHSRNDCGESLQNRMAIEQDSCTACHMPKLSADDVPHTSQTDHRVPRRRESAPDTSASSSHDANTNESLAPFDSWEDRLPHIDTNRAWGLLDAAMSQKRSAAQTDIALQAEKRLAEVIAQRPDDIDALGSLGAAYVTLNRTAEARRVFERILEQDPINEFALLQMALLLHADREWQKSLEYWPRAIDRNPWIPLTHVQYGQTAVKAGKIDQATNAALRAVELNPAFLPAHIWLGENLPRMGKPEEGQQHRVLVEKLRTRSK